MILYTLSRPYSRSLYQCIRADIENGTYLPGSRLPSKRQFALDLHLSLSTVENALSLLEEEGYIECLQRKGMFVLKGNIRPSRRSDFVFQPLPEDPIRQDPDFPASLWFKTMRLVMSRDREMICQMSPAAGCARLRNAIARYLHQERGMHVQPEQIVIASGSRSLYEILARLFQGEFDVAIESPGFAPIEAIYTRTGAQIEKLPLDTEGIQIEALKNSSSSFLHVSPFSSYPSQIKGSPARRKVYLDWIASRSGYLIEDDYNSEFFQNGPMLQTLYSLDGLEKVIYLNTFSKSISPSVRLGYMVLPCSLLERYEKTAGAMACTVTMLEQYTLAEFMENGSFERLIARRRRHQSAVG